MDVLHYIFTFVILHNIKYFLRRLYIFLRSLFASKIRQNLRNVKLRCIDGKIKGGVKNNYSSPRVTNSATLYIYIGWKHDVHIIKKKILNITEY